MRGDSAYFARVAAAVVLVVGLGVSGASATESEPERPRVSIDTTYVEPSGRTLSLGPEGDLQAALNTARPGDTIELAPGAIFKGNFTVPKKPGAGWIVLRSSGKDLPAPGIRVTPADATKMAKIVSPNTSPALIFDLGARHYRLVGIEITTAWTTTSHTHTNLVILGISPAGNPATTVEQLPTDIIFDRCYIHGNPTGNVRRGIALNSARTSIVDSHLSEFHEVGGESQAIAGWNGSGPFKITNNYIEAAGINILFGGSKTDIPQLVSSDIEVRNNHFFKPLSWKKDDPGYAGVPWMVKNLFELKNAQRVLIDANVFENSWAQAQTGPAIVLSPKKEYCTVAWAVVNDVTFTNNVVRHAAEGMRITAKAPDCPKAGPALARVLVRNNLFADIGGPRWGMSDGFVFLVISQTADVVIEHNTAVGQGAVLISDGEPSTGFVYRNNIAPHNAYGVFGSGKGVGNGTLKFYFPQATFTKNVLAGPWPTRGGGRASMYSDYPENFFPDSIDDVGFRDPSQSDYGLSATSRWKGAATDGADIGADFEVLRGSLDAIGGKRSRENTSNERERTVK